MAAEREQRSMEMGKVKEQQSMEMGVVRGE